MPLSRSATQIIAVAYRHLGGMMAGQGASADIKADGLEMLNEIIDSELLNGDMVYAVQEDSYTLAAGTQEYRIGPGQVAPNIDAARPTWIEEASIGLNTVSPVVYVPISVLQGKPGAQAWQAIQLRTMPNTIPQFFYYDQGNSSTGYGTIKLWGGPQSSYLLNLFTWKQLQEFASLTTVYAFPPGYVLWLGWELASKLAPMMLPFYMKGATRQVLQVQLDRIDREARKAKAQIVSYNSQPPLLSGNPLYASQGNIEGDWNYLTGAVGGSF